MSGAENRAAAKDRVVNMREIRVRKWHDDLIAIDIGTGGN